MAFISWQSYWRFSDAITSSTRYIYDEITNDFITEVLVTSESRKGMLKKGYKLFRAQIGCDVEAEFNDDVEVGERTVPYSSERMYPLKHSANEGRVNPKGIPYLYLSTKWETAMSECRPWVGTELSVGQFETTKELSVIDCSKNHSLNPFYYDIDKGLYEPDAKEREKSVWAHIDRAFSTPVSSNESQAHYAPTQVLAEAFKSHGYDGIIYKSMLGDGYNLALFDVNNVNLVRRSVYKAKSMDIKYHQIG